MIERVPRSWAGVGGTTGIRGWDSHLALVASTEWVAKVLLALHGEMRWSPQPPAITLRVVSRPSCVSEC